MYLDFNHKNSDLINIPLPRQRTFQLLFHYEIKFNVKRNCVHVTIQQRSIFTFLFGGYKTHIYINNNGI